MKTLIIINDAPYGTEIAFNALRIANQLGRDYKDDIEVRIFLMAGIIDWNNGNWSGRLDLNRESTAFAIATHLNTPFSCS